MAKRRGQGRRHASDARAVWVAAACAAWTCLASGCASIDQVNVQLQAASWIEGATQAPALDGELDFGEFDQIDLSQNPVMRNRNVRRRDIDRATVSTFWLEVRDPANGQDLTFIKSITIFVEAPGMNRVPIAQGGNFPSTKQHVDLQPVNNDVAPFAAAESMKFLAVVSGVAPPQRTKVVAEVDLVVDINVQGLLQ